tara:strand:+ start:1313 stop:1729 length:417 start_codon:yes stop_codon:yes gene_type:complete
LAKYVVTGNNVSIAGSDVSASVARAELTISSTEVDVTDFASGGFTEVVGGLKSGSLALDFHQDFGAGALASVLNESIVGTLVEIIVIAGNGSTASADTPSFTGQFLVNSVSPVSGAVGDLSTYSITFPLSGAIVKAVS